MHLDNTQPTGTFTRADETIGVEVREHKQITREDLSVEARIVFDAILARDRIQLRLVNADSVENVAEDEPFIHVSKGTRSVACTIFRGTRKVHFDRDRKMFYGKRDKADLQEVKEGGYVTNLNDIVDYLGREGRYTTDQA